MKYRIFAIALCGGLLFFFNAPQVGAMSNPPIVNAAAPLGADFSALHKDQAKKMGIAGGVVVVKIYAGGTLSNQTKMKEGFIITSIGGISVSSVAELNAAMRRQKVSFQIEGFYPGSKQAVTYSIHDF